MSIDAQKLSNQAKYSYSSTMLVEHSTDTVANLVDHHDMSSDNSLDQDTYRMMMTREEEEDNFEVDVDCSADSADDCSNGGINFFEGAEKRLAIYLSVDKKATNKKKATAMEKALPKGGCVGENDKLEPDLRKIPRAAWEVMLNLVNCRILNVISNEHMDAYLLSESSMFVSKNRVIVKTCGSTTLLNCLEEILQLVKRAGFESVEDVFYSHKNLLVPSLQLPPHHSFLKESDYLDKAFNGLSHLFGHVNSDRFYLYTLDNNYTLANENEHFKFEIIMEELDDNVMDLFVRPVHGGIVNESITGAEITRKSGIDKLIPGMIIDDFLFTPCGYSMNGLLGKHYMTIHITPETDFSYVSLETSVPMSNYPAFIRKIIALFKPGKFMLNLIAPDLRQVAAIAKQRLFRGLAKQHKGKKNGFKSATAENGNVPMSDELFNIHGVMIYEELLEARFAEFRRVDLQLAHCKHSDIVYARYVAEGIS